MRNSTFSVAILSFFLFTQIQAQENKMIGELSNDVPNYSVLHNKNCSGKNMYELDCYQDIIKDVAINGNRSNQPNRNMKKAIYEGNQIILDTEDKDACDEVTKMLSSKKFNQIKNSLEINDLCRNEDGSRYKSITLMWDSSEEYLTPIKTGFITNANKSLANDTRNLSFMMAATMGLLWVGPESVSKWKKDEIREKGLFHKWNTNFHSKPVMDQDDPFINYVGHPISGAIYYNIARSQGYTRMESFGYSVLMSTFFWEYGFEAIAEKPSIQDLFVTPIIGSVIGELFYYLGQKIENNDGKVLGSKKLGSIFMFFLNPGNEISNKINSFLGKKIIQNSKTDLVLSRKPVNPLVQGGEKSNFIGIRMNFGF